MTDMAQVCEEAVARVLLRRIKVYQDYCKILKSKLESARNKEPGFKSPSFYRDRIDTYWAKMEELRGVAHDLEIDLEQYQAELL